MLISRYFTKSNHNDYAPINGHSRDHRKANIRLVLFALAIVASVALNVVFLVKHLMVWPGPLDDYQQL